MKICRVSSLRDAKTLNELSLVSGYVPDNNFEINKFPFFVLNPFLSGKLRTSWAIAGSSFEEEYIEYPENRATFEEMVAALQEFLPKTAPVEKSIRSLQPKNEQPFKELFSNDEISNAIFAGKVIVAVRHDKALIFQYYNGGEEWVNIEDNVTIFCSDQRFDTLSKMKERGFNIICFDNFSDFARWENEGRFDSNLNMV